MGSPVFLNLLALLGGVYDCGQSFFSALFSRGYSLVNCRLQVIGNGRDRSDLTLGASVRIRCASCSCATSTLASRRPVSFSDPALITGAARGRDSSRLPWSLASDLCADSLCSANRSLRSLSLSGLGGIGLPFRKASAAVIFHCLVSSFFLKYSTWALLSPAKLVYILDHFSSMVLNSLFLS